MLIMLVCALFIPLKNIILHTRLVYLFVDSSLWHQRDGGEDMVDKWLEVTLATKDWSREVPGQGVGGGEGCDLGEMDRVMTLGERESDTDEKSGKLLITLNEKHNEALDALLLPFLSFFRYPSRHKPDCRRRLLILILASHYNFHSFPGESSPPRLVCSLLSSSRVCVCLHSLVDHPLGII